jgi:hypothetical protein
MLYFFLTKRRKTMVGTQKLLYILPDLAYTAEILKGKKEGEYSVQSFHQVNGEFMADDNLLPENLKKLFDKIEAEEYTLVLPDFLFADTIVSVPGTDDAVIAGYLRNDLLPKIGVSTLTHETKTTILMQRKSESRVQFTALEKEIADMLGGILANRGIKILDIVPLSWTVKSLVSLEPSVSVVQIGTRLYLAEHYVGVNQTSNAPLDSVENIVETITTLKGADPNLQTLYLLTNSLVEEKMRAGLSKTLPVQQLTLPGDDNLQMPSYVKQLIEAAGATLNDKNYPVPHFALGGSALVTSVLPAEDVEEVVVAEVEEKPAETEEVVPETEEVVEGETVEAVEEKNAEEAGEGEEVVAEEKTDEAEAGQETQSSDEEVQKEETTDDKEAGDSEAEATKADKTEVAVEAKSAEPELVIGKMATDAAATVVAPVAVAAVASEAKSDDEVKAEKSAEKPVEKEAEATTEPTPEKTSEKVVEKVAEKPVEKPVASSEPRVEPKAEPKLDKKEATADNAATSDQVEAKKDEADPMAAKIEKLARKEETPKKKGRTVADFFKKLLLFIFIFALTIAVGLGVGYAVLRFTGGETGPEVEPIVVEEIVEEEPIEIVVDDEATESADLNGDDVAELDLGEMSGLVVNATGVAGMAGNVATALTNDGFGTVNTGNARGTYTETVDLVKMPARNSALINALEAATGLSLTFDDDYTIEDPSGDYDAVIVINAT